MTTSTTAGVKSRRLGAYQVGCICAMQAARQHGGLVKSPECDQQVDFILASTKIAQPGIVTFADEQPFTRKLAMSVGFDVGRRRGKRV